MFHVWWFIILFRLRCVKARIRINDRLESRRRRCMQPMYNLSYKYIFFFFAYFERNWVLFFLRKKIRFNGGVEKSISSYNQVDSNCSFDFSIPQFFITKAIRATNRNMSPNTIHDDTSPTLNRIGQRWRLWTREERPNVIRYVCPQLCNKRVRKIEVTCAENAVKATNGWTISDVTSVSSVAKHRAIRAIDVTKHFIGDTG